MFPPREDCIFISSFGTPTRVSLSWERSAGWVAFRFRSFTEGPSRAIVFSSSGGIRIGFVRPWRRAIIRRHSIHISYGQRTAERRRHPSEGICRPVGNSRAAFPAMRFSLHLRSALTDPQSRFADLTPFGSEIPGRTFRFVTPLSLAAVSWAEVL